MNVSNPILREIDRLTAAGNVVKGVWPDELPGRHSVKFRLSDGSTTSFYFDVQSDKQFHVWLDEAFRSLVTSKSLRNSKSGRPVKQEGSAQHRALGR